MEIFAWLIQLLIELLLQIIGEAIAELFVHSVKEPFRRPQPYHPLLAALGYAIFGAIAGGISIWLLPTLFIKLDWLRLVNLVITPAVAGFVMAAIGSWRRRHDLSVIRLESFSYGFCFAFSMALVRQLFGHP